MLSITLRNFRQFKGEQSFLLDDPQGRNTVLIFGANGSGKTTLLNAFTWALYGRLSEDVEVQERMITDFVWRTAPRGAEVPISVELEFEHQGQRYRARRLAVARKDGDDQPELSPTVSLWTTKPDGSSSEVPAPQQTLDAILPPRLSRFFFFNGERIEKLATRGAYSEVREDIKTLLGIAQVERALEHLPRVATKLGTDVRRHGGERAAEIQSAIDTLADEIELGRDRAVALKEALSKLVEEREQVRRLLREHEQSAPLQRERDRVEKELTEARQALQAYETHLRTLVATKGFLAFTEALASRTTQVSRALYEKGALPAPLKREFVDRLLSEEKCICTTALTPGSAPWQEVTRWRMKAGLAEVEAAWQRLEGQVGQLGRSRDDFRQSLKEALGAVNDARTRVQRLEEEAADLRSKLEGVRLEDVSRLNSKEFDLDTRIARQNRDIGDAERLLADKLSEHERNISLLDKAKITDSMANLARERQAMVRNVERALRQILQIRSNDMAARLDAEVKRVFASVTAKPFIPQLDSSFELGLYQAVEGQLVPVARSTGENQILSLSFVAAVSKLAREIKGSRDAEQGLPDDWGIYPVVMDAAFGSLDQNYQRDISQALGKMAPQLVVLVSKSQGLGQVLEQLREYTGRVGVIVTHSTNVDRESEKIELDGRAYPYLETRAEADWAELMEVK
jgi:DNA sulfur modification protein DndD